jgi:hypothetical protein
MELVLKPEILTLYIYMDLRLATLKAVSFYLLHNFSTLNHAESYPVAQLYVNTLLATNGILIQLVFNSAG